MCYLCHHVARKGILKSKKSLICTYKKCSHPSVSKTIELLEDQVPIGTNKPNAHTPWNNISIRLRLYYRRHGLTIRMKINYSLNRKCRFIIVIVTKNSDYRCISVYGYTFFISNSVANGWGWDLGQIFRLFSEILNFYILIFKSILSI